MVNYWGRGLLMLFEPFCIVEVNTGGSHLSHTAVKPDSHLAQIFFAKFLCIIKLIIIIG